MKSLLLLSTCMVATLMGQQPCIDSVPECTCDFESAIPSITCSAIEDIDSLAEVFHQTEISPENSEKGIDVTIALGTSVDGIPIDVFGSIPLSRCTLHASQANIAYFDFAMFEQSAGTLEYVHLLGGDRGSTVVAFPDSFSGFSNFTSLALSHMAADLRNLASPTLQVIQLAAAILSPFYAWDLPALKTISNSGPWKLGGYLPQGFAANLFSLESLTLDGPLNYVDNVALNIPSQQLTWLLLVSPFFKPNSLSIEASPDATIRAVYQGSSTSNDPDFPLPIWAESVVRMPLESMANGSGELQIYLEYPGFNPCPCDIAWLLSESPLLEKVYFMCRSVQTAEQISIRDATLADLDC